MRSIGYQSRLVSAPGVVNSGDMVAVSMPEGHARGIVIDNPSGSWLSVSSLYDLVPPYVLQWSRDLPVGAASVTVRYVEGPVDQPSTQQGTPFTLWLDTEPVGGSNGIATPGAAFRPLSTTTVDLMADDTYLGLPIALIPTNTGRRARIYAFRIGYSPANPAVAQLDMGVQWRLQPDPFPLGAQAYAFGRFGGLDGRYYDEVIFGVNPRDVSLGTDVALTLQSDWADGVQSADGVNFRYHLRYSLV